MTLATYARDTRIRSSVRDKPIFQVSIYRSMHRDKHVYISKNLQFHTCSESPSLLPGFVTHRSKQFLFIACRQQQNTGPKPRSNSEQCPPPSPFVYCQLWCSLFPWASLMVEGHSSSILNLFRRMTLGTPLSNFSIFDRQTQIKTLTQNFW